MPSDSGAGSKGTKRKLDGTLAEADDAETTAEQVARIVATIKTLAEAGPAALDRPALRRATHALADLAKSEDNVDAVVEGGAVAAIVPLLTLFPVDAARGVSAGEDVEKEACFILGLLAIKQEHQHAIADAGALPGLVALLGRHNPAAPSPPGGGPPAGASVVRRAADAVTNLAHENVVIKSRVRQDGGIPPLVALLESPDAKVQRAAAGALRTLAFKNEDNKHQIVECGALPTLVHMLRSDDAGIHYEAVGVVGNLVHSSAGIKLRVLHEGALQPVIGLLSSRCAESQREAALLLGQFATVDDGAYRARIAQRGAVPPLVAMLGAGDVQLQEMAAFALGRLAQNLDNQAGVVQAGGLPPLLKLLRARNGNLQHNAAFALYGLADCDDNVAPLVREGGVAALLECELLVQASKDCVQKTLKRLEDKLAKPAVLAQCLHAMRGPDRAVRERTAAALARLAREADLGAVFVERKGVDVLLGVVTDPARDARAQREAAAALFELARKANATAPIDCAPAPPTPQVYLGEQYVNNPTLSDITFVVEGRTFHAHRIALLASSDTFRAMFDGAYREKDASEIPIPNIRYDVFESMMRCVYTGSVDVDPSIAADLLRAADQYMLDGLKRLCEASLASSLTVDSLHAVHDLSEAFAAPALGRRCVLFALERYDDVAAALEPAGYTALMRRMVPKLREGLTEQLTLAAAKPMMDGDGAPVVAGDAAV